MTTGLAVTGGADCGARGEVATLVGAGFWTGIVFETALTTGSAGDDEDAGAAGAGGAGGVAAVVPELELPELALISRSVIGLSTDGGSIGGLRVTGLLAMLLTGLAAGLFPAGLLPARLSTGGSQVVTKKLSARLRLCSSCPRRLASAEV